MAKKTDASWLSEAVVEFLKGPMYINPLMSFIDEKCLIFTPEEENKFEYTVSHNEFKELVDRLLTEFLGDLGVSAEQFYQIVADAQGSDQLTSFVVQTILTVDDFLMFKAMMVRRNIDLTNQVLDAVEASQGKLSAASYGVEASGPSQLGAKAAATEEEAQALKEAMAMNERMYSEWQEKDKLQKAMRALQVEDEDPALVLAIAASLRDQMRLDSELAEIEQAIAMSLMLEEERKRLLALQGGVGAGPGAGGVAPAGKTSSSGATTGAAAGDAAAGKGSSSGAAGPAGAAAAGAGAVAGSASGKALGASSGAAAGAGAAGASAPAAGGAAGAGSSSSAAAAGGAAVDSFGKVIAKATPQLAPLKGPLPGSAGAPPPAPLPPLEPVSAPRPQKFVPAPIDAPTGAPMFGKSVSMRKASGFRSEAPTADLEAVRKAAQQAAESQKKLVGKGQDDEASRWLQEAKRKLIAQKQAERDKEMSEYQSAAGARPKPPAAAAPSADDAKRAALREALAQKMKQNIMQGAGGQ